MSTGHTIRHVHNKFEINRTKIKGGCQSGRKVVSYNSKSDLPLEKVSFPKTDCLEKRPNCHLDPDRELKALKSIKSLKTYLDTSIWKPLETFIWKPIFRNHYLETFILETIILETIT